MLEGWVELYRKSYIISSCLGHFLLDNQGFWNPREELSEFVYFPKWSVSSVFKVDVLKENKVKIGIFQKALN